MDSQTAEERKWQIVRKIWHFSGCVLMIAIFYWAKDTRWPVKGVDFLTAFAWFELLVLGGADMLRFHIPQYNQTVKEKLGFYGKIIRSYEETDFQASTYYILASVVLITCYRLGFCREATLVMSILVLGIADPIAALVREIAQERHFREERAFGLVTFLIASFLVMGAASYMTENHLTWQCLLCVSAIVAPIETYTRDLVVVVRPLTRKVQNLIRHRTTLWLLHFYPDDNLLVPLVVALFIGLLSQWI